MPDNLLSAHERNDEVMERIYIGPRFKNDTERLGKLFELYTKMTASVAPAKGKKRKAGIKATVKESLTVQLEDMLKAQEENHE